MKRIIAALALVCALALPGTASAEGTGMYLAPKFLMTMQNLIDFQQKHIKGQKKSYLILGKESDMDFDALSKFGKVKKLTLNEIFGY